MGSCSARMMKRSSQLRNQDRNRYPCLLQLEEDEFVIITKQIRLISWTFSDFQLLYIVKIMDFKRVKLTINSWNFPTCLKLISLSNYKTRKYMDRVLIQLRTLCQVIIIQIKPRYNKVGILANSRNANHHLTSISTAVIAHIIV